MSFFSIDRTVIDFRLGFRYYILTFIKWTIVMSDLLEKIDKFFRITERGSTFQKELRGGIITFLAMAYILIVNPNILSEAAFGYSWDALFTATALATIIACLLMGIYSRFPVAVAPGMGVNAFLSYTICLTMGFSFPQGLMVVFISGIVFLAVTVTGLRERILDSIPMSMKYAISAGIGFFIAVVGLFNGGIIIHGSGSALALGPIFDPGVLLSLFCLVVTLVLWIVVRKFFSDIPLDDQGEEDENKENRT